MDLDSYQIALEEVLTWLLSAEDTFQEQDDISDDVEEVKDQFATHEVPRVHNPSGKRVARSGVTLTMGRAPGMNSGSPRVSLCIAS